MYVYESKDRLKFNDFTFYHLKDDSILNDNLETKGLITSSLEDLIDIKKINFNFKYDNTEVLSLIVKEIINKNKTLKNENFIVGINFFKPPFINNYVYSDNIYEIIKNEWKYFAIRCQWHYCVAVKLDKQIFFIDDSIETHFEFPENNKNIGIFKNIVIPNQNKHFVFLSHFSDEEKQTILPKSIVFKKIENYFINNFYNCANLII